MNVKHNGVILGGVEYTNTDLLELPPVEFALLKANAYRRLCYYREQQERTGSRLTKRIRDTMEIMYQRLCACDKARKQIRQQHIESQFIACAKRRLPQDVFDSLIAEAKEHLHDDQGCQGQEADAGEGDGNSDSSV